MFLITIFTISSVIEGMHWVRKRPPPGNQLPFSKRKTIYLSFFNLLSPLKTEFDLSMIFTQLVVFYLWISHCQWRNLYKKLSLRVAKFAWIYNIHPSNNYNLKDWPRDIFTFLPIGYEIQNIAHLLWTSALRVLNGVTLSNKISN